MGKVFTLTVAVGLMAALMALPGAALGRAVSTDYTFTETQTAGPLVDPDTDWTKPIVHAEFESVFVDETTDDRASGIMYVTGRLKLADLATFSGNMRGTSVTVVSGNGYEGTWVGRWQGKLVNGVGSFKVVAHGTGDLAGMKMFSEFTGQPGDRP